MNAIYGRKCTLTIFKDNTYTALPYCTETVRCVNAEYMLAGTVGKKKKATYIRYAQEITGCVVTRLTGVVTPVIFGLLKECDKPFDILINRVIDKIVYKNVVVVGFELRARLDGAVYIHLDIAGAKKSYGEPFTALTHHILWQKTKTYLLRDGDFSIRGQEIPQVYLYALTGTFREKTPMNYGYMLRYSILIN